MSELKKEFKSYMNDLESNIENKKDLEYIKERTSEFMNVVLDEMEQILNYKEEKISQIEKIQSDLEEKINTMQQDILDIEEDIYNVDVESEEFDEDNYDFQIVCPYCETEFLVDLNQETSEIECPECKNIIELEWSGNLEEDTQNNQIPGCGAGHCSGCKGCENTDLNKNEDDM